MVCVFKTRRLIGVNEMRDITTQRQIVNFLNKIFQAAESDATIQVQPTHVYVVVDFGRPKTWYNFFKPRIPYKILGVYADDVAACKKQVREQWKLPIEVPCSSIGCLKFKLRG